MFNHSYVLGPKINEPKNITNEPFNQLSGQQKVNY